MGQGRGLASLPFVLAGACAEGRTRGLLGPPLASLAALCWLWLWCRLFWGVSEAELFALDGTFVLFIFTLFQANVDLAFRITWDGGESRELLRNGVATFVPLLCVLKGLMLPENLRILGVW